VHSDDADTVAATTAKRCADTDISDDADTANDAFLTTLANAAIVEDDALVNAPMAYRTAEKEAAEVAVIVTAARLTP
jgi:hypothetical protein